MLELNVVTETFDDATQRFAQEVFKLELEHSLSSLSKWEQIHEKPFLTSAKTSEETLDYVKCMMLTPDVTPEMYAKLSHENYETINTYITRSMTATTIRQDTKPGPAGPTLTSEVLYYMMITLAIPMECQYWHLNRLIMQIRVCTEMNAPQKKRSAAEIARERSQLNAKRLAGG